MDAIHTESAPAAIGTYSQAIKCGQTVYLSGQIALEPSSMQLCSNDIKAQTHQVFKNITAVCEAAGGDLAKVVKLTVYLVDLNNFSIINEVMAKYFVPPYPARAALEVSALPRGARVEMDAIMVLGE